MNLIILGVIGCIIIGVYAIAFHKVDDKDVSNIMMVLATLSLCILIAWFDDANKKDEPKAIDVYRGNTTLQITYKGGIPTDTIVVFKD